MGFLDRMVSDLIRDNTGINARRLVRRIGGGKLLALGGAALAATLMAGKEGALGQGAATHGGQPAASPPPPPVPRVPGAPAGPPPVPGAAPQPAEVAEIQDEPPDLTYAAVRTMVAAALADGHLAEKEKALVHTRLGESGLSLEQTQQVHKDLVLPPSVDELAALAKGAEAREVLYRFAAAVVLADEETSDPERRWLARLAAAFGIDGARQAALEAELFASEGDDAVV